MTFIENKYRKIYQDLIDKRRNHPLSKSDVYCESHHIIPKSLGGSDDKSNLVNLLPREHYIAHKLLTYITRDQDRRKMMWALHRLVHGNVNPLSSKQYDLFRRQWSVYMKENHHSKDNPEYIKKLSEKIEESWVGADDRRRDLSDRMKETHLKRKSENLELYYQQQKENSVKGVAAMKEKVALRLEYKGSIYVGWRDLLDQTGCSKFLYKKFYEKGIDPTFRIGKDGPMTNNEVDILIEEFCRTIDTPKPIIKADRDAILTRMINCGIITQRQVNSYMSNRNLSEKGGVGK